MLLAHLVCLSREASSMPCTVDGKPSYTMEVHEVTSPFPKPLPVIPGGFLVRLTGNNTAAGTVSTNQFAFSTTTIPTGLTAAALATAVGGHWADFAATALHQDYVGAQAGCYDLSVASSVEAIEPMTANGNVASVAAPPNIGFGIEHSVGVRHKQGHTRISPVSNADIQAGTSLMVGTSQVRVNTAFAQFIADCLADTIWGAGTPKYCILSYQTAKVSDPRLIPVISSTVHARLASIRRRRGY